MDLNSSDEDEPVAEVAVAETRRGSADSAAERKPAAPYAATGAAAMRTADAAVEVGSMGEAACATREAQLAVEQRRAGAERAEQQGAVAKDNAVAARAAEEVAARAEAEANVEAEAAIAKREKATRNRVAWAKAVETAEATAKAAAEAAVAALAAVKVAEAAVAEAAAEEEAEQEAAAAEAAVAEAAKAAIKAKEKLAVLRLHRKSRLSAEATAVDTPVPLVATEAELQQELAPPQPSAADDMAAASDGVEEEGNDEEEEQEDVKGLQLHKSAQSATGYKHVHDRGSNRIPNRFRARLKPTLAMQSAAPPGLHRAESLGL